MRESKEARTARQRLEVEQFVKVLRDAGNTVELELRFDVRPSDKTAEPVIPRRWRFDVALPGCGIYSAPSYPQRSQCIAIDIQGFGGGHQTTKALKDDIEKLSEAFAQGWTVLLVTREMIRNGEALDVLARRGVRVEAIAEVKSLSRVTMREVLAEGPDLGDDPDGDSDVW